MKEQNKPNIRDFLEKVTTSRDANGGIYVLMHLHIRHLQRADLYALVFAKLSGEPSSREHMRYVLEDLARVHTSFRTDKEMIARIGKSKTQEEFTEKRSALPESIVRDRLPQLQEWRIATFQQYDEGWVATKNIRNGRDMLNLFDEVSHHFEGIDPRPNE